MTDERPQQPSLLRRIARSAGLSPSDVDAVERRARRLAEEIGFPSSQPRSPEAPAADAETAPQQPDTAERPKPEEAGLPAEEAGSPSAVTDPKTEEADLPAEEAGSPSAVTDPKPEEADLPAEEAALSSDVAKRPNPREIRAMRRQRRASSDIAEHPKPEEADRPAEEAGSPSAVTDPKPEEADRPAEEAGSPSAATAPKPEEADRPAEEAGSPSAVVDPKPEEADLPAEEVGSPSAATAPKPEEADLPVEEVGSPSAVADPKPEEAGLPAEEAASSSAVAERPKPEEAALPVEEAGSPPATAERLNQPPIRTGASVATVPVGDWAYDVKEWAWATLSAMRQKAAERGSQPELAELTPKSIRIAMAAQLNLTPAQRDFPSGVGGVEREREYATRCTTMRLLLAHCALAAKPVSEPWSLTAEGTQISESELGDLIDDRLESFELAGGGKHQKYRGRPGFPNGATVAKQNAPEAHSRSPSRPSQGSSGPATKRWVYDRHVWGAATLIAIRNVINRGDEWYAANSEVTYEMERVLRLSPQAKRVTSRPNPAEADYKARCHTMRLHLLVAEFIEKRVGEPGWCLAEKGKSATADEVFEGLDDAAQHTSASLFRWQSNQPAVSQAAGLQATEFFYPGNSALTEGGTASLTALRERVNQTAQPVTVDDSEAATAPTPPDARLSPVAEATRPIDAPATEGGADDEETPTAAEGDAGPKLPNASTQDQAATDEDAPEDGEPDDGMAAKWVSYAIDQELSHNSVPYLACVTMSIIHEVVEQSHNYSPTVQMINDRLVEHLRETSAASDRDGLRWSEGSVWWWRFYLARMSLWHGAKAIHPVTDGDADPYHAGAEFVISDGAANWDPEKLLHDVQQYLDDRVPIKWNYDFRAWMWEVLLAFRTRPSDALSRRPVATFQELTRTLTSRLPVLAKYVDDGHAPLSTISTQRPEHMVRSHTALRYLEFLNLCGKAKRQSSSEPNKWELTDEGDTITSDEFYDLLAMFADVTTTDLKEMGFEGLTSDLNLTYAGSDKPDALADVDELKKDTRRSDTELCVEVVRELIETDESEVLESKLWERIGQKIGLPMPLARSKDQTKKGDLPPWCASEARVRTLFAYRMRHVMQALSLDPAPTIKGRSEGQGKGREFFWRLAEEVDRQTLISKLHMSETNGDGEDIDFGKDVADYFARHDYSAWRTEPWMEDFCEKLADLARKSDGKLDGTLFELLITRLLTKELGSAGEVVEAHHVGKNDRLDDDAIDIVVKIRRTRQVGEIGTIPIYDHPEDVVLVQCKHQRVLQTAPAERIFTVARRRRAGAGEKYRVTQALLVYLGDLDADASGKIALTLQGEGSRDASSEEAFMAPSGNDDGMRFDAWDGGKVLQLIKEHGIGVRGVGDGDAGESDELEVDVEWLDQLKLEVADLQSREKQGQS